MPKPASAATAEEPDAGEGEDHRRPDDGVRRAAEDEPGDERRGDDIEGGEEAGVGDGGGDHAGLLHGGGDEEEKAGDERPLGQRPRQRHGRPPRLEAGEAPPAPATRRWRARRRR